MTSQAAIIAIIDNIDIEVFKATESNIEVRCDLQGCLKVIMASEAAKIAIRGNMHIYQGSDSEGVL